MPAKKSNPIRPTLAFVVMTAISAAFLCGCGAGYLDLGEKVEATEANREILDVLKTYHKAIEDRDVEKLRKMVSRRFFKDGGTTESDKDDYGIDKLNSAVLLKLRDNVRRVQFRIKLLDISVTGDKAKAQYEYFGRVLLTEGGRDSYKMWNDFAQMDLVRESGHWKIFRGL